MIEGQDGGGGVEVCVVVHEREPVFGREGCGEWVGDSHCSVLPDSSQGALRK
jgi:hypothetical protein